MTTNFYNVGLTKREINKICTALTSAYYASDNKEFKDIHDRLFALISEQ